MKIIPLAFTLALAAAPALHAEDAKTYVGVVTDTMCATDHAPMKVAPEARCVRDCVGDGKTQKYALAVGKQVYTLSDQETPARFAGQKVKVTGILYTKTNVLKVTRIEAAR
jgi:hypothetical protein